MRYAQQLLLICSFILPIILWAQDIPKYRIDPAKAYGGVASDYFSAVDYIPLETTKESLFGEIRQLVITDKSFVVSDLDTRSVLFFSLKGKFINKIKGVSHIFYDKAKQEVVTISSKGLPKVELNHYTKLGERLSTNEIEFNSTNRDKIFLIPLQDDFYLQCNSGFEEDLGHIPPDPFYFLSIYRKDSLKKRLMLLEEKNRIAVSKIWGAVTAPSHIKNGEFYISSPLTHVIYKVNKDTAMKIFQFVFPQNRSLPAKILESSDIRLIDSVKRVFEFSTGLIQNVQNIIVVNSLIIFNTQTSAYTLPGASSLNEFQYNFAYDTTTTKLFSFDRIAPDALSGFLPLMGERSKYKGFIYFDNNFYGYISSLALFNAKERAKSKNAQYSPVLQDYFRTQNRKSNPVIVKMKLKE